LQDLIYKIWKLLSNYLPLRVWDVNELTDAGGGGGNGLPVMLEVPIFLGSVLERDKPMKFSLVVKDCGPIFKVVKSITRIKAQK